MVSTDRIGGKWTSRVQWAACGLAATIFVYYIVVSIRWPLVWDSAVMHYIAFLISRGYRPYAQITDMNLPGSYLTERLGMAIFGWSDTAWRLCEFVLIGAMAAGSMVIGGSRRWFAGVFAATFFVLMHGSEGPLFAMERDEVMTVLMVLATAALFVALRKELPAWMLGFGLLAGFEAAIKPSGLLLDAALLGLVFVVLRGRGTRIRTYMLYALAGHAVSAAVILGYFLHYHALKAFLFVARTVLPSYGHTNTGSAAYLLRHAMPPELILLAGMAFVAAVWRGGRRDWERWALLLGAAAGAISYFAQGKGYPYHRYLLVTFTALWVGWELTEAMRSDRRRTRLAGYAGVGCLFLVVAPFYLHLMEAGRRLGGSPAALAVSLESDLDQLGGQTLQRKVQCMDVVNGCLSALYHLRLEGNTASTGDLLLFAPTAGSAVTYYRDWLLQRDHEHPAEVVVLGNEWYQNGAPGFAKVDTWPAYAAYLRAMYVPVVERHFGDVYEPAYRIYLRKGSAVLTAEEARPLR